MEYKLDKIVIQMTSSHSFKISTSLIFDMEIEGYFLKEEYTSTKMMGYMFNYVFKRESFGTKDKETIFVGISRNTYKDCAEGLLMSCVEYNPQKTQIPECLRWFFFSNGCKYVQVNKCDVALDFDGFKPEDCYLSTSHKIMIVGTSDNLTRYIRPSDSHLRVKIYDKKKERMLFGEVIPQRLRVEISLKHPQFHERDFDADSIVYLNEVQGALAEVCLFSDLDRSRLESKYGKYDECTLYLLFLADQVTRDGALFKMGATARVKYRAWLRECCNKPVMVDPYEVYVQIGAQLRDAIDQVCLNVKYLRDY